MWRSRFSQAAVARPDHACFPLLVVAGLIALGAAFLFTVVRMREPAVETHWPTAGLIVLTLVVYAVALSPAGYIVATAIFFPVMGRLLGSRRPSRDLPIGIGLSVAIYFVFTRLLEVRLPGGLLEGLM